MTWLKFSCTPGTGWHKNLLPFVVMACIGFAGSSAAAPAQPAPLCLYPSRARRERRRSKVGVGSMTIPQAVLSSRWHRCARTAR